MKCHTRALWAVVFASNFAAAAVTQAALRVDINPVSDRKDALSKTRENWNIADGPSATQEFDGVTVTLRAAGRGGGLTGFMWKGGFETNAVMASDGMAAAGPMELVLSGLPVGRHSIATFHNDVNDSQLGGCTLTVNGTTSKSVQPTQRTLSDYDAASAYATFEAKAGQDVVISIDPGKGNGAKNIVLSGFEIDTVDPTRKSIKPVPAAGDEHAPDKTVLSWTAAKSAKAHRIYFGTNAQAVQKATGTSGPEFSGEITATTFTPTGLNTNDTYYSRVDQVAADKTVTTGDLWSFRVRHDAFPGAEGYGRFARGGRGGKVFEVTTLEDSGPGSLREAVEAEGPRTVVFRVGGTIMLKKKLVIRNPYITIAGQTAPGDGICIGGYTFGNYGTHDSIIRYVRIRISDESRQTMDGTGFASTDHSIMDHCSVSWSIDEAVSSRGAKNITFQRGIVAQALNIAGHAKYGNNKGHSYAGSISGKIGSYHHNLVAHCAGRNWSLAGGMTQNNTFAGYLDIRNNVVYNWWHRTNDGGVKALNLVGNYYIPGPASKVFHLLEPDVGNPGDRQQYFMADNRMEGRPQYDRDNWANGGAANMRKNANILSEVKLPEPFCDPLVTTQPAKDAYESVIADVGANWPRLDSHDQRVLQDVIDRTSTFKGSKTGLPGIIDSQTDAGGWPVLKNGPAPKDTDHDGMPDDWEKSHGLNPNDPADGNGFSGGDGYSNLERYLNGIVTRK